MSIPFAAFVFFLGVILLATIPFVPALRELRLHRDAGPLQITRRSRVDIRHFARGFQDFVSRHFTGLLDETRHASRRHEGHSADLGSYVVVPQAGDIGVEQVGARMLLGSGDLSVLGAGVIERETYSQGDLVFEGSVTLRAALAEGSIELATGSKVLRWVHAEGNLLVGKKCLLYGRASAGTSIQLAPGVRFERMHAPRILVGEEPRQETTISDGGRRLDPEELGPRVEFSGNRALVRGDADIPAGALVDYDVVARQGLTVGAGAWVRGSLKARGELRVGAGARVEGSLVCENHIVVEAGASVHGPLLAEETLSLARDVCVGEADRPSTVRGREISVTAPAVVHGSLWAEREGKVVFS